MPNGQCILLVEDIEANRIVAMNHLKRAGYTIDVAVDGQQAVDAVRGRTYDLILMDIEMPALDGWEASARIRRLEQATCLPEAARVPIIVMSGHALRKDEPRFQQVGICDCLVKPIVREQLLAVVGKWIGSRDGGEAARPPARHFDTDGQPVDLDKAVEEFMGDTATLQQVLLGFVQQGHGRIAAIEEALVSADLEKIRREAHALKGGASNLTAFRLAERCARLEKGAAADQQPLARLFEKLKDEFNLLAEYVQTNLTTGQ